ncbi:hypothetical protein KCP69_20625 [Salmonella enterica subsp. enterica]|nr:hypothetical protein KCP69_20625 [Salmonella enterica subsp. enterica]
MLINHGSWSGFTRFAIYPLRAGSGGGRFGYFRITGTGNAAGTASYSLASPDRTGDQAHSGLFARKDANTFAAGGRTFSHCC